MVILKLIIEVGTGGSFSATTPSMVQQDAQQMMGNVGLHSIWLEIHQMLTKRKLDTILSRPIMTITQSCITAIILGTVPNKKARGSCQDKRLFHQHKEKYIKTF